MRVFINTIIAVCLSSGAVLAAEQDKTLAADLDREANKFIEAKQPSQDLEIRRINKAISEMAEPDNPDDTPPSQDLEIKRINEEIRKMAD